MADSGKPKVRERAALLMRAVVEALDAAGGSLRLRDIMVEVPKRVALVPFDQEIYRKSGYIRWKRSWQLSCAAWGIRHHLSLLWAQMAESMFSRILIHSERKPCISVSRLSIEQVRRRGIIRSEREVGLFVSTSGFTSEARREARTGTARIELMDWNSY
jgi:hypothetical protein